MCNYIGTVFAEAQEPIDPDLRAWIVKQLSPPTVSPDALNQVTDKLLELYPDDPSVGSPFGTGDELFGFPSSYKRRSALGTSLILGLNIFGIIEIPCSVGDMWFTGPRRLWSHTAAHCHTVISSPSRKLSRNMGVGTLK